jgi:hypothetical protein
MHTADDKGENRGTEERYFEIGLLHHDLLEFHGACGESHFIDGRNIEADIAKLQQQLAARGDNFDTRIMTTCKPRTQPLHRLMLNSIKQPHGAGWSPTSNPCNIYFLNYNNFLRISTKLEVVEAWET